MGKDVIHLRNGLEQITALVTKKEEGSGLLYMSFLISFVISAITSSIWKEKASS